VGGQNCQDVFCYTSAQCPNPMVTARLQLVNNRATYFPIAPTQTSIVLSPPKCNLHSWLPGHVGTHAPCGRQRLRPALSWSCTRNHATAKAEGRERRPFCNTRGEARVWCLQAKRRHHEVQRFRSHGFGRSRIRPRRRGQLQPPMAWGPFRARMASGWLCCQTGRQARQDSAYGLRALLVGRY